MKKKNRTIRSIVLDFVQANGPQPYSELQKVVLIAAGRSIKEKHWGSGYLDFVSSGSVMHPNRNDPRYLDVVKYVNGKAMYDVVLN